VRTVRAHWLGARRIDLEACESTNDEAARFARAGASHGTIVIADVQRAGRGREGRVWESPRGMGLYLSAILRPPLPPALVPAMTLAIGVGLCDAARAFGAPAVLKWPNDALVGTRKLAGVLVEAHSQGNRVESVVAGIGVNLCLGTTGALPPAVAATAITIEEAAGTVPDREAFIAQLCAHVELWIDRYIASGLAVVAPAWHERMARGLAARATPAVEGAEPVVGEVVGLDGEGALLLQDSGGCVHRVRSGDVEVMRAPAC
jgi:BirA family transcriptional regulator, biotin operon repressor / biotin---[acetyl-CoA-carboxylase] ligase